MTVFKYIFEIFFILFYTVYVILVVLSNTLSNLFLEKIIRNHSICEYLYTQSSDVHSPLSAPHCKTNYRTRVCVTALCRTRSVQCTHHIAKCFVCSKKGAKIIHTDACV